MKATQKLHRLCTCFNGKSHSERVDTKNLSLVSQQVKKVRCIIGDSFEGLSLEKVRLSGSNWQIHNCFQAGNHMIT